MKKLSSAVIRKMFIDFFKEKNHQVEPSASLVPVDDPSLLWINSGVATLKKYFDGRVIPDNPRIVNAQKAIRTNDIENVGYTARHHTFFEMLGNFSIGDYFKEEAIAMAWEFLTSDAWLGLEAERLSVTVHPEDDEAYDIWLKEIQVPKERIVRLEENFWDIGEGPSGPNSEIFYDRGEELGNDPNDPELYPGGENSRYLEIWNLVFSQFNHNPDHTYTPLPQKNIDTGMGLERITSILQEVPTNFDTDLFVPIISKIEQMATIKYSETKEGDTAYKVIADHIRTVSFAVGDGALPANEGRGYVLRRLLRRAVRFAKEIGIEKPFMYSLVETVGEVMNDYYPEVTNQKGFISDIIRKEEERFHETLNDGLHILTTIMEREKKKGSDVFPGEEVFRLYDTYGFPKELTAEYVEQEGFSIDEEGFDTEMEKQRERARNAREKVDSMQVQNHLFTEIDSDSEFVGYIRLETDTEIEWIIRNEEMTDTAEQGEHVYLFLKETPFYAESGGQIADKGWIVTDTGTIFVEEVQKTPAGKHVHQAKVIKGTLEKGQTVTAKVDRKSRAKIVKNHTATHLLHQALKDVLGHHVNQAGSLVAPDRLRFDFSHFQSVTEEELKKVEQIVNEKIWEQVQVTIDHKELDEAKQMGAMALFGEKYDDIVRVVQIGDYSLELCGGCHVGNTAEIGLFKITSENGIGAGIRRVEAVTSEEAYQYFNEKLMILEKTAKLVKANQEKVPEKIESLFQEIKELEKENKSFASKLSHLEAGKILDQIVTINGIQVLAEQVNAKDMNQLRNMADELKQRLESGIILLAAENGGKVQLVATVSKDLNERGFHAGNLIKQAAQACGGGGGGRPDMAQAGGKEPENIHKAIDTAKQYVELNG